MNLSWYDKLIDFAKQKSSIVVWFFLCSAALLFTPNDYLKVLHLNDLPEYIESILGFILLISCILIIIHIVIWGKSKYAHHTDVMKTKKVLLKLKNLSSTEELEAVYKSYDAIISWANRVSPLLKFNEQYYVNFAENAHKINIKGLSVQLYETYWNIMKSQVEMAIAELENELNK